MACGEVAEMTFLDYLREMRDKWTQIRFLPLRGCCFFAVMVILRQLALRSSPPGAG